MAQGQTIHQLSPLYILSIVGYCMTTPPFDTSFLHSNSKLHLYLLSTPSFYIHSVHTQHCRILSWYRVDVERGCREEVKMKFRVRVQKGSVKGGGSHTVSYIAEYVERGCRKGVVVCV